MTYNIGEFDFHLPQVSRSHSKGVIAYDMTASVNVKGKKRKATVSSINMTGLERKLNRRPESVAFGVNKYKKKSVGLLVIDNQKLESVPVPTKEAGNLYPIVNNKALVQRLFNFAGVSIPEVPDTSAYVYFHCSPVAGQPGVIEVSADHVLLIDANGGTNRKNLKVGENGVLQTEKRF